MSHTEPLLCYPFLCFNNLILLVTFPEVILPFSYLSATVDERTRCIHDFIYSHYVNNTVTMLIMTPVGLREQHVKHYCVIHFCISIISYLSAALWDCIQYRSKVSYHLSSLVSRDESLVSREPLKRIFWNTLQAIGLQENELFLAMGLPRCTCMLREIPANTA